MAEVKVQHGLLQIGHRRWCVKFAFSKGSHGLLGHTSTYHPDHAQCTEILKTGKS